MIGQEDHQDGKLPELYSKTLILVFAIFLSVLFAAALLVLNLQKLGKIKEATWVVLFTIAYLFATAFVIQEYSLDPSMTFIANVIGAAILNEFFWNKYIGSDLEYRKKDWIKPTLMAIGIAMLLMLLLLATL